MVTGIRSALVVPFDLPSVLEEIRRREVGGARIGVPAHVTILFPFVAPREISAADVARVAEAAASVPAFDVEFDEVRHFEVGPAAPEGVLWLAPEPPDPFLDLLRAILGAYPQLKPYEGLHDDVIPHLTIASDAAERMPSAAADASRALPIRLRATALALLVQGEDAQWRREREFPLG